MFQEESHPTKELQEIGDVFGIEKQRKPNPLRDSLNPFLTRGFNQTSSANQNSVVLEKMRADPGFNVLEINIRNMKEFIKTKKVDEEVGSYIGFVIDILQKECQQLFASDQAKKSQLDYLQDKLNDLTSKYNLLKIKYSQKKKEQETATKKYKIFEENLVQYKDNPKELIWEFKRLMMDNEIKSQEIGFLKTMLQDMKSPDPKKSKS